jgi:lipoyl(octanoyl) transferase
MMPGAGAVIPIMGQGNGSAISIWTWGARGKDVRNFVHHLEGWVIDALGDFDIAARRAEGRIGIWTDDRDGREAKIGALGIRVRRWVTLHGFAINVDPDLSHFGGIVPCGIADYPVTSIAALGKNASMARLDEALKHHFPAFFGPPAPLPYGG